MICTQNLNGDSNWVYRWKLHCGLMLHTMLEIQLAIIRGFLVFVSLNDLKIFLLDLQEQLSEMIKELNVFYH